MYSETKSTQTKTITTTTAKILLNSLNPDVISNKEPSSKNNNINRRKAIGSTYLLKYLFAINAASIPAIIVVKYIGNNSILNLPDAYNKYTIRGTP